MWGPDHVRTSSPAGGDDSGAGAGAGGGGDKLAGLGGGAGGVVDPALSLLILRFATMIVQKVGVFRASVCFGFDSWWRGGGEGGGLSVLLHFFCSRKGRGRGVFFFFCGWHEPGLLEFFGEVCRPMRLLTDSVGFCASQ